LIRKKYSNTQKSVEQNDDITAMLKNKEANSFTCKLLNYLAYVKKVCYPTKFLGLMFIGLFKVMT